MSPRDATSTAIKKMSRDSRSSGQAARVIIHGHSLYPAGFRVTPSTLRHLSLAVVCPRKKESLTRTTREGRSAHGGFLARHPARSIHLARYFPASPIRPVQGSPRSTGDFFLRLSFLFVSLLFAGCCTRCTH